MSTPAQISDFVQRMNAIEVGYEEARRDMIAYAEWMDAWRKRESERVARENKSEAA